ncbi:class II fructose-bisphosphate aldolase [Patescibacteria group bacterium]|nr:class II fructose-bisphosphate aldolase [Patescibacteria group bacterium]MBU4022916.1 class II fructose-bisphosphate aldolase [Patescibacteria group bacterium]
MKSLKSCFQDAKKNKFAIGQFNFSAPEQLEAIVLAGKKTNTPVILGTSQGEARFFGLEKAVILRNYYRKIFPNIYLNLDHGMDIDFIKKAIDLGYDCVHFDGGHLSLEQNIKQAKEIVQYAHKRKALVEGEIKAIKGGSVVHEGMLHLSSLGYESVSQAEEFVEATNIDSLAINIGNVHGVFKNPIKLNINLLKELNQDVNCFLVLHGGSGTNTSDLKEAIKNGIVKININTELRIAWKQALRKELKKKTIKPYEVYPKVIEAVQKKVEEKIKLFK